MITENRMKDIEIVRVIRVLIYEGERDWVESTVNGSIHGMCIHNPCMPWNKMHAMQVGEFPEILPTRTELIVDGY
jgi:hypothetical protein